MNYEEKYKEALDYIEAYINAISEEPASEDLEGAAEKYAFPEGKDKYDIEEAESNGIYFRKEKIKDFKAGAKWADQHPRKGLWDAEKVCGILHEIINSDTIVQYLIFDDENIDFDSELFFDDLRKAMED